MSNRVDKSELVYLDSNVVIEICDGYRDSLKAFVQQAAQSRKKLFPFSAALISEITSYPLTDQCLERLRFLSQMSNDLYFVFSLYDHEFRKETPMDVWRTLHEALPELDESALFAEMVPYGVMRKMRNDLGLDPKVLNNMSGSNAVAAIDSVLENAAFENGNGPKSLKEILDCVGTISRDSFSSLNVSLGTTDEHMGKGDQLHGTFALLEAFGYWPDTEAVYRKGSRFSDSQHVFNAAHCDCLVTRDKGMKNRAEAVYSILGIDTEVLHTDDYVREVGISEA